MCRMITLIMNSMRAKRSMTEGGSEPELVGNDYEAAQPDEPHSRMGRIALWLSSATLLLLLGSLFRHGGGFLFFGITCFCLSLPFLLFLLLRILNRHLLWKATWREGTTTCIALGDISGKGMSAALLMATLHSAVRAFGLGEEDISSPARMLDLLNRHLLQSTSAIGPEDPRG